MKASPGTAPRWPIAACSAPECGAPMMWGYLAGGGGVKRHPFDAAPSQVGNIRLIDNGNQGPVGTVLTKEGVAAARAQGEPLHTSHFTTCTAASTFRRPKR